MLRPPAAVPTMAVAAALTVLGASALVGAASSWLPGWFRWLGGGVLALGGLVWLASAVNAAILRAIVVLDRDSITVTRGRRQRSLTWRSVETVSIRGPRLALVPKEGQGRPIRLVDPGGKSAPVFAQLVREIRTRLDTDRGYRPVT